VSVKRHQTNSLCLHSVFDIRFLDEPGEPRETRTAFFTVAWQFWWTMAKQGADVLVQEELLIGDRIAVLGPTPDPDVVPYELLEPIRLRSEDGDEVSTWRISLADVASFAYANRERKST
jgi:hypothetical protein